MHRAGCRDANLGHPRGTGAAAVHRGRRAVLATGMHATYHTPVVSAVQPARFHSVFSITHPCKGPGEPCTNTKLPGKAPGVR